MEDRAWWAWNNYAYFDQALWSEWMLEKEFARLIAQYDASHQTRVLGFIPAQYALSAPEIIYNDEYIDAVYNPVYTTPSIVVDSSAGTRLSNLIEGASRTFGRQSQVINTIADRAAGLQFVSVPAGFDPTYQIDVKRDGDLYIFGPRKTPLADGVGNDAPKWVPVSNLVLGTGIDAIYQRKVTAGDKIRIHGVEWSVASEQIELLDAASPAASTAVSLADAELTQLMKSGGVLFDSAPELKDYLRIAQGAEKEMLTPLGNVNDDEVGLCHAALAMTQKMSLATAAQSSDHELIAESKDLVRQVKGLEDSLNDVDELRDPGMRGPALGAGGNGETANLPVPSVPSAARTAEELQKQLSGTTWAWPFPGTAPNSTFKLNADGTITASWHNLPGTWVVTSESTLSVVIKRGDRRPKDLEVAWVPDIRMTDSDGVVFKQVRSQVKNGDASPSGSQLTPSHAVAGEDSAHVPRATHSDAPIVTVQFASGSTELATLEAGTKYFSNRDYPLLDIPQEVLGMTFTRRAAREYGDITINAAAGATVYLLLDTDDDHLKDAQRTKLNGFLAGSGWTRISSAVIIGSAAKPHEALYKQLFLKAKEVTVADAITDGVVVISKNLVLEAGPSASKHPTASDAAAVPQSPPSGSAALPAKTGGARTVDLLALVDPKRDAVKGDWRMQDNMLVLRSGNGSQLIFPYQPPTEYDYCAEFIRSDAKYGNAMLFPHGNQTLHFGNSANGENFGPLPKGQGSGTLHIGGGLPHKVRIEVRTDRLRAFVDEKLILDYPTDYSEFEDTPKWTKQTTHLALQDFWSNVTYQKVEVIERSGPGTYFPPDGGSTQEIPSHAIKPASPSP